VAVVISLTVFPARAGAAGGVPLFAEQLRTIDAALALKYEESALLTSSRYHRAMHKKEIVRGAVAVIGLALLFVSHAAYASVPIGYFDVLTTTYADT
jgi:hypothetical protein